MDVKLDKRLTQCLQYLKGFDCLYDVGTDHAYLPIQALLDGTIKKAYAVDNKTGPLSRAKLNIENAKLDQLIVPVLSDGINELSDDVDVVNIAGLGGKTIYDIIKGQPIKNVRRFVLQPNMYPEQVRALTEDNFKIVDETICLEDGVYYPIIVLEVGAQTLTTKERLFGPFLLKQKHPYLKTMLENELKYLQTLLKKIPETVDTSTHVLRKTLIEEVLYEDFSN